MKTFHFLNSTKKLLLTIILITSSSHAWCQSPLLGQSAGEIKRLVDYEVSSYYRAKGYHQIKMDNVTNYKNGQISEVVICKENVPMADLMRTGDFCTHYIMSNGRLSLILTQYSNISIEDLEKAMSVSTIKVGNFFFNDDNETYYKIYQSQTGQATKEFRSRTITPIPVSIQNQLTILKNKKEEAINNQPFDVTDAIEYKKFVQQDDKILYTYMDGMTYKQKVNLQYVQKASAPIKAVLGYYTVVSNSYKLTQNLGLGEMCSNQIFNYIKKYFHNDPEIIVYIPQCQIRAFDGGYHLNRLELSIQGKIINVSYSMTYYENYSSKDNIVGIDQFKINDDNTLTVVKISSKESLQKRSEEINSQIYDVKETDANAYESFKINLKFALLKVLKEDNHGRLSFDQLVSKASYTNFVPSWSISNNYNINWTILDDSREGRLVGNTWVAGSNGSRFIQQDTLNSGNDYQLSLLKDCRLDIPELYVEDIKVKQRTISVKNVQVNFEKGISYAKVKNDNIDYIQYPPSSTAAVRIKSRSIGLKKGDYLIKYEFGNVMGEDYENIIFEKR